MGNLQNARSAQFMRQVFLANDDFSMAMNKAADESERRYLRACEENYRKIMQAKFGDWMEKIGGDQRNKNVTAMKTVEEQPRYIVLELLRRQLIPIEKLEVATDTTTAILKQCIDHRNYIGESQPHDANLQQQAAQMLRDRGVTVPGGQQGGQQRRAA